MPGLLRGVARTAVVAGTATAVSNRVSRRQARRWSSRSRSTTKQHPAGVRRAAPPPAAAAATVPIAQLKELAALKDQGILTEEEFAVQKAKLLNM